MNMSTLDFRRQTHCHCVTLLSLCPLLVIKVLQMSMCCSCHRTQIRQLLLKSPWTVTVNMSLNVTLSPSLLERKTNQVHLCLLDLKNLASLFISANVIEILTSPPGRPEKNFQAWIQQQKDNISKDLFNYFYM